jgi:hypothetical protein
MLRGVGLSLWMIVEVKIAVVVRLEELQLVVVVLKL